MDIIVSAATKFVFTFSELKIEEEVVICSPRHFDNICDQILDILDENYLAHRNRSKEVQGFVNQRGEFLTREEALQVATKSGQLDGRLKTQPTHKLFSEDLY